MEYNPGLVFNKVDTREQMFINDPDLRQKMAFKIEVVVTTGGGAKLLRARGYIYSYYNKPYYLEALYARARLTIIPPPHNTPTLLFNHTLFTNTYTSNYSTINKHNYLFNYSTLSNNIIPLFSPPYIMTLRQPV